MLCKEADWVSFEFAGVLGSLLVFGLTLLGSLLGEVCEFWLVVCEVPRTLWLDVSKSTNNSSGNEQQLTKILCSDLEIREFSCSLIRPLKHAMLWFLSMDAGNVRLRSGADPKKLNAIYFFWKTFRQGQVCSWCKSVLWVALGEVIP